MIYKICQQDVLWRLGHFKADSCRWFTITYNFSNSATSAFGNNLKAVGSGRYALYNGDINNDGIVNTLDVNSIGNDASGFMGAYLTSDLNGDGIVDSLDLMQADNNAANFVPAHTPEILGAISKRKFLFNVLMKCPSLTFRHQCGNGNCFVGFERRVHFENLKMKKRH